jgi:hypothetical protein
MTSEPAIEFKRNPAEVPCPADPPAPPKNAGPGRSSNRE